VSDDRKLLTIEQAVESMAREPGLVIGPGACTYNGVLADIRRALVARLSSVVLPTTGTDYFDVFDIIETLHASELEKAKQILREEINRLVPSIDVPVLASVNWVACVSLCPDTIFDAALRDRRDRLASSRDVTTVDSPLVTLNARTLPIYRLLGTPGVGDVRAALCYSKSDLLIRESQWPAQLASFSDRLKDSVLVFLGTEPVPELTAKYLATIFGGPRPHPSRLMFMVGDQTPDLPLISALIRRSGAEISRVDGDARQLASAIAGRRVKASSSPAAGKGGTGHWQELTNLQHLGIAVPGVRSEPEALKPIRRQVVDSLFRPASDDWRPYQFGLPLERSVQKHIIADAIELAGGAGSLVVATLHGAAGVGKTTALRSVAHALAAEGYLVLWCKRAVGESTAQQFRKLITAGKAVLAAEKTLKKRLIFFVDDPWALRISAAEALAQAEASQTRIMMFLGFRDSDYVIANTVDATLPGRPDAEFEVPHILDAEELSRLKQVLVNIGASRDEQQAAEIIAKNPYAQASDILCSLWYLIPDTRAQFESSLADEYRRLGNASATIEGAASSAAQNGETAKAAYEAVAVTSSFNIGLPVEVLVRSLDVDYRDWFAVSEPGKPIWGLLYDTYEEISESFLYRTRNEIVTQVLLRLVNGGLPGHSGQYRVLKRLLAASGGSAPAYKAFVHDILVRSRDVLEKMFTFEQGLDLYDTALTALSNGDRSIEHHKGLWIKNVGRNLARAYDQLQKALAVPDAVGSTRDEPREYIHTSLAATVLAQVRAGELTREAGFEQVVEHLRRASSFAYFNPNQSHVMANALLEMAQVDSSRVDALKLSCLGDALAEIERSLQLIGASGRTAFRYQKALVYFQDLQRRVVEELSDIQNLDEHAEEWFTTHKRQIGFVAVARKMLAKATRTDSGGDYKKVSDYLDERMRRVQAAGLMIDVDLHLVRADLIIRWRLQKTKADVDWPRFLENLEQVLGSPRYRDDVLRRFYYAVALYQLGRLTDANATFAALRRMPNVPSAHAVRCVLVGNAGFPKRLQGVVSPSAHRQYVSIGELGIDVPLQGNPETGPGGTLHVYIGFTIYGPIALSRTLEPGDLLLPVAWSSE
jgi:hypothetical protein